MTGSLRFPPFAGPGARARSVTEPRPEARAQELPSIDNFIDELPPIEDFVSQGPRTPYHGQATPVIEAESPQSFQSTREMPPVSVDSAAQGWAEGDWQSYDWNAVSPLTRPQRRSAAEEWGDSDWPGEEAMTPAGQSPEMLGPDEIADALDGIARRIRSGELVIDNVHDMPPEAAMAAALAVLLRMRG